MSPLTPQFLLLALGLLAGIEGVKVNSPLSLTQCQPYQIGWSEAKAPIFISAVQDKDTASEPLIKFPTQSASEGTYTWPAVNITAGTTITLVINDGNGQPNFSSQVKILDGSTDCLTGAAATTPATGASSTAPITSTAGTIPASGTSTSKPVTTTPSTVATGSISSSTVATNGTNSSTIGNTTHTTSASTGGSSGSSSGSKGKASFNNAVALGAAAALAGLVLGSDLI